MTSIVVDASAAAAWLVPSQASAAADAFQKQAAKLVAPAHFRLEIRNVAWMLERRGALPARALAADVALLESRVDFDAPPTPVAWIAHLQAIDDLARTHGLTVYDAAYLELALRLQAALASRDKALLAAAAQSGAPVYDLR